MHDHDVTPYVLAVALCCALDSTPISMLPYLTVQYYMLGIMRLLKPFTLCEESSCSITFADNKLRGELCCAVKLMPLITLLTVLVPIVCLLCCCQCKDPTFGEQQKKQL